MDRTDLQDLAETRLREAQVLLGANEPSGAYYLAGYAVECGLKACIAQQVRQYEFPNKAFADAVYTHNLNKLLGLAGLQVALNQAPQVSRRWGVVKDWKEASRYEKWTFGKARELIDAVSDPSAGVLPWIKQRW